MTSASLAPEYISKHPCEAHVYNHAAELLRGNPCSSSLELTAEEYRRIRRQSSLNLLLGGLGIEFGRDHAKKLFITIETEVNLDSNPRYFVRFRLSK